MSNSAREEKIIRVLRNNNKSSRIEHTNWNYIYSDSPITFGVSWGRSISKDKSAIRTLDEALATWLVSRGGKNRS